VLTLLRRLRVRRCLVVGNSMGGLVASRLAKLAPQRVSRLLLYEPPIYGDVPEFKTHARRRKFYFGIYERIAANPPGRLTMARVVARISGNWTQFLASEQLWLPIERSLRNTILNQTSYEELKDTAIRTDIVHGRLDVAVSGSGLKRLLAHNPNIRFYKTTDRHGLSKRSARYLAQLISAESGV
jgi:pimeloyl-ACP methyl ester carboxylesterase